MVPRPLDAARSIGWPPVRTCPSFGRFPHRLRILPFPSCSCTELPAQSSSAPWPSHTPPFCPSTVNRRSIVAHAPPPRDTKKRMPLSCLESPPIKEKTIKTRYEIKGNMKKKPRYTQPPTETPRKMPEIYTKRIATLTAHNTLKSLPPSQPRWGRQLIKEEATSPQRRPAATRGTAGVAVRRRYRRGSGRTRGR